MVRAVRPESEVRDADRFDETLGMANLELVVVIQGAASSKAHVFNPCGGIPHATSQAVPGQFSIHGNEGGLGRITGHAAFGEGRGFMGQEGHLRRHVVALHRTFHFFDDRHHGDHHQADDGQHATKQKHGGHRSRNTCFIAAKGASHRLTSTRWMSTSKYSGRSCDETLRPSAPLARS